MVDYFNFSRETARLAMSYVDRFLSTAEGEFVLYDRRAYQLASISSLSLAVKVNESMRNRLDSELLVMVGRGNYSSKDICDMEIMILFALKWHLTPPTSSSYLEPLLDLLPSTPTKANQSFKEKIREVTWN